MGGPTRRSLSHAARSAVVLLLVGWVAYQVSFIRSDGRDFRTAGTIVSQVVSSLEGLPSFQDTEHLFLKGLPSRHGKEAVFYDSIFEPFFRANLENPDLEVHRLDRSEPFPRPFPGARFLLYRDQELVEVQPPME